MTDNQPTAAEQFAEWFRRITETTTPVLEQPAQDTDDQETDQ